MMKHKLIKELSVSMASLALLCPLALGEVNSANADATNQNQSTRYINKAPNNQNNQGAKSENNNSEMQLSSKRHKNNTNVENRKNTRKVRGRKYNYNKKRHHAKRNLKNLKKHRKGLYSKLKNNKQTRKHIKRNKVRYTRFHAKKHVKRNVKSHIKRTKRTRKYCKNTRTKNNKRVTRKHVVKKHTRVEVRKHSVRKHKSSSALTNTEPSDNNTSNNSVQSVNNASSNNDSENQDNSLPPDVNLTLKSPEMRNAINTLGINFSDLNYDNSHSIDQLIDNQPSTRTPVNVQSVNTPTWYLRSRSELEADRNPFRNWNQSQFNKYEDLIIKKCHDGSDDNNVPEVEAWGEIATEYCEADPNAQQAVNVADLTWND